MGRLLSSSGCLTLLVFSGCAICASSHDAEYAAYGGLRQRADMIHGRVGSVFDPAPEVSHEDRSGQSPELADPALRPPERSPDASFAPDDPGPSAEDDGRMPHADPAPRVPEPSRPLPDGTIELPEATPGDLPIPDDLPSPGRLPPDLPRDGNRAQRHPLHQLLNEQL